MVEHPVALVTAAGRGMGAARTAAILLSEEAGYVTGQNLRVDGGLTRSV